MDYNNAQDNLGLDKIVLLVQVTVIPGPDLRFV